MGILKNLFNSQTPLTQLPHSNPDNKQENETYVAYGTRICAKVNGSHAALQPCLQRIYLQEKRLQSNDQQLQDRRRNDLNQELVGIDSKINSKNIALDDQNNKLSDNRERHNELLSELISAKNTDGEENKMARIKMSIGIVILLILSIYLFIFYSSTFYSAFFKQFSFDTNVAEAMFDQQALPNALDQGIGSLIFILCAPIIFMGLGYVLHYYATEKGVLKYFKIAVIVAVTFIFDCILAYLIAKKMYEMEILTQLGEFSPFSISMAIKDPNVWAVIFCGFITYMIWGFVFDLTISAYEEIRSNKKEIERIESEIKQNRKHKEDIEQCIVNLRQEISDLDTQKHSLRYRLSSSTYFYDENIIRTALTDFFTGWIVIMSPMGHTAEDQDQARAVFNQTLTSLFN